MSERREALSTVLEGLRSARFTLETSCSTACRLQHDSNKARPHADEIESAEHLLNVALMQLDDIASTLGIIPEGQLKDLEELFTADSQRNLLVPTSPCDSREGTRDLRRKRKLLAVSPNGGKSSHFGTLGAEYLLRARAREAFELMDMNSDGTLELDEIKSAMQSILLNSVAGESAGISSMLEQDEAAIDRRVRAMIEQVDKDGDGCLDLHEFVEMMFRANNQGNGIAASPVMQPLENLNGIDPRYSRMQRMSMLARSVLIAHRENAKHKSTGNSMYIIHPFSSGHTVWDLLMTFLIFITIGIIPVGLAWEQINCDLTWFNFFIDALFVCDVFKNFFTGYLNENDVIVLDRRLITIHYMKSWFLVDAAASIGGVFDFVNGIVLSGEMCGGDEESSLAGASGTLKAIRLMRVAKMLRVVRVSKVYVYFVRFLRFCEERYKIRVSDTFLKVLRLVLMLLLLAHWIGCMSFMICRLYGFPEDSWVAFAQLAEYEEINGKRKLVSEATVGTQYAWSLFKALCSMLMLGFEGPPITNVQCVERTHWCSVEHWTTLLCL